MCDDGCGCDAQVEGDVYGSGRMGMASRGRLLTLGGKMNIQEDTALLHGKN